MQDAVSSWTGRGARRMFRRSPWVAMLAMGLIAFPVTADPGSAASDTPVVVIRTLPPSSSAARKSKVKTPAPRSVRSRTAGNRSTYRVSTASKPSNRRVPSKSAPQPPTASSRPRKSAATLTRRVTRRTQTAKSVRSGTKAAPAPRTAAIPRRSGSQNTRSTAAALNARGYALLKQGKYGEAEAVLRQAVRANPNYAYALYNLGWSLVGQGKGREAVEPLRESAALQPGRWEPQQRLAEAYEQMGNSIQAFEARARARELRGSRRRASLPAGRPRS